MQCRTEHSTSSQTSHYRRKIFNPCLQDPGKCPDRNDVFGRASLNNQWMSEYPNHYYQDPYHSTEGLVTYDLPQSPHIADFYGSHDYCMNEASIRSSYLYDNGSLLTQRSTSGSLRYSSGNNFYNSPSVQSSSSNESPVSPQASQTYPSDNHCFQSSGDTHGQVGSGYNSIDQVDDFKYTLQELETALLGSDIDDIDTENSPRLRDYSDWNSDTLQEGVENGSQSSLSVYNKTEFIEVSSEVDNNTRVDSANEIVQGKSHSFGIYDSKSQHQEMDSEMANDDVSKLLLACAKCISEEDMVNIERLISELRQVVSISGEPVQRLGAYMLEGLVARLQFTGATIYKSLKCKEPTSKELLSYMQVLYEKCPYFKFGYTSANGAIAEALKDDDRVHIIDFQIAMGSQWVALIQALAQRQRGPPHLRITGIDDPVSEYARGGGLELVGKRLSMIAESCGVPFEFDPVPVLGTDVQADMFKFYPGEVLAVNFAFQLHHMPDESVSTSNHRDRILRMVRSMRPKILTLAEQEANTNTTPFFPRFKETLSYYTAMFQSLDVTMQRDSKERINAEQHCLARDIVNVIACEGAERVERHELMGKWRSRLHMAGFKTYPLSKLVNSTIKDLLQNYSAHYRYFEKDDSLYLGWQDRDLVAVSAWH